MTQTGNAGHWARANLWLPHNESAHHDSGELIVAYTQTWPIIRDEILNDRNPSHPVHLVTPLSSIYGYRFHTIRFRNWHPKTGREHDWREQHIKTSLEPAGRILYA